MPVLARPGGADDAPHAGPRRFSRLVPIVVAALTASLIGWTAWPTLRPTPVVMVSQVLFDAQAGAAAEPSARPTARPVVQAPGWLEAEPFYVAATALADGVVASMEVLEGDRVEQGQIIARLVDEDARLRLRRAEARLAASEATLALSQAEHDAAQTHWDEPVERERAVATHAASLEEARATLAQLPSLIEQARAEQVRLDEELSRAEQSRTANAVTELDLINARQRAMAQGAAVRALEATRPILEARVARLESELAAARRAFALRVEERRDLEAARARLEEARARRDDAQAARDEAALELDRMTIRAPITGFVQRRFKAPGDTVARMMDDPHSAHIVHLYHPDRLQVRVDVPLADARHIRVGQSCEVVVEVLPDTTFRGEVLRVTHEADLQKNTLQVKVRVLDPSPLLRPEMLTRVKFLAGGEATGKAGVASHPGTVLVPGEALDQRGGTPRVWTVRARAGDRGRAHPVPVRVLGLHEGWTRVEADLRPGAPIVLAPVGLEAGTPVRITMQERPS